MEGLGYDRPSSHLPYRLIYIIALIIQLFCVLLSPLVTINPTFSPMRVALAGTHHFYSCERAKADFGYRPIVEFNDAVKKTLEHFKFLKKTT